VQVLAEYRVDGRFLSVQESVRVGRGVGRARAEVGKDGGDLGLESSHSNVVGLMMMLLVELVGSGTGDGDGRLDSSKLE
jgi:hypothetical protein